MSEVKETVKKAKKPPISGKLDISEATVIEMSPSPDSSKGEPKNSQDNDYVKNLKDQDTVDLNNIGKNQSGEKVTIDFMNEDHIKNFTSSETKVADENEESTGSNFDGKSAEDLQKEIKDAEEKSTKNFTAKDFEDIAKFIIFLIDTGLSSGLKWWAKDTSDAAYSLPEKKKEMLVYQLTLILTKYQAKFSIEFMFILTILIVYAPAFMKAKGRRKENAGGPVEQTYTYSQQASENAEAAIIKTETPVTAPKRKRGNPGKA